MSAEFLYCIEMKGQRVAKVGVTSKPHERLHALQASAPFLMSYHRLIQMVDRRAAQDWEKHVITHADQHTGRGEWVMLNDKLDQLLSQVPGIRHEAPPSAKERGVQYSKKAAKYSAESNLRLALTASDREHSEFRGIVPAYEAIVIRTRLAQGYGVEDIAALDKIDVRKARAEMRRLVKSGAIYAVLGKTKPAQQATP